MTRAPIVCFHALVLSVCISASLAGESVAIGTILSFPSSYQLHDVTLQGTVRQVHLIGVSMSEAGPVYDAYTFNLDDGTGVIEVFVEGALHPGLVPPPLAEGERVLVQAHIAFYNVGEAPQTVKAWSRKIQRLGN